MIRGLDKGDYRQERLTKGLVWSERVGSEEGVGLRTEEGLRNWSLSLKFYLNR